jgi:hypothetical protein
MLRIQWWGGGNLAEKWDSVISVNDLSHHLLLLVYTDRVVVECSMSTKKEKIDELLISLANPKKRNKL